jgi:Tol biopolymer transport system component
MPRGRDSLEYSNDGNFLATSSLSDVHLFDGNNGKYKFSISGNYNSQPTQYFAFSEDSKTVVVVSDVKPYTISFWGLASGKETASIPTGFEYIRYVSLSPDGKIVATIDYKGIHLWDVNNRSLLTTISGRFGNISWNPNSSNFALLDGNNIVFRNAESGDIEKKVSIPKERFDVVISKDWTYMAVVETVTSKDVTNINEKIELWDMNGNKLKDLMDYAPLIPPGTSSAIYDFQFSPDDNLLVAVRYDYENYSIRFWDTATGQILRDVTVPFRVSEMDFSPDGKRLTLLGDGIIYVIGVKTP